MPLSTPRKAKPQVDTEAPLSADAQYVVYALFPELERRFREWSKEYKQQRDLGKFGEFVGLYRKARKLKSIFIDGVDPSDWRESVRTIALEVAAHALLLVKDLDDEEARKRGFRVFHSTAMPSDSSYSDLLIKTSDAGKFYRHDGLGWVESCSPECYQDGKLRHTRSIGCRDEDDRPTF